MIIVDERDGSRELIDTFMALGADPNIMSTFHGVGSTADVIIDGNGPEGPILVGVEVKKVSDALSSESTGRLAATQLPELLLSGTFQEVWLLTIGDYRAGHGGRLELHKGGGHWYPVTMGQRQPIPFTYFESFLVEVQALGVHLKQVADVRMACCWLTCCHHFWQKPWDKHKALKKFDRSKHMAMMPASMRLTDPDYARKEQDARVYSQLPNIGWERAWALANHFPTVIEAGCVSVSEWTKVNGIGATIARIAQGALRGGK